MTVKYIDLRSDTVTLPTKEMREAIYNAHVGDDVYGEDPTVNRLEEMAAEIMGKEAALFVTSGTQGNQISVMTHTQPGDEIILEEKCHIITYEVGGMGRLAGVRQSLYVERMALWIHQTLKLPYEGRYSFPKDQAHLLGKHSQSGWRYVIPMDILKRTYEVAKNTKYLSTWMEPEFLMQPLT